MKSVRAVAITIWIGIAELLGSSKMCFTANPGITFRHGSRPTIPLTDRHAKNPTASSHERARR
eukprot:scaffold11794_cov133-Skeletonema_marinoi.AAC.10